MAVWPGFGVNYKAKQSNWVSDIAFFQNIGLSNIRPNLVGAPVPWTAGDPSVVNSNAYWRLCCQTFINAGFYVTWGMTRAPLTASNWQAYHDSVVSEATYLQSQNIVLGDFELGNELENGSLFGINSGNLTQSGGTVTAITAKPHGFSSGESVTINNAVPTGYNGTYSVTVVSSNTFTYSDSSSLTSPATGSNIYCYSISPTQLIANITQLATDVKSVYNLAPISYAMGGGGFGTDPYAGWIANGLGNLDYLSIHPYGNINTTTQTVQPASFSNIAEMVAAFGNQVYISEFNLDAGAADNYGLHPPIASSVMSNYFNTYILNMGIQKALIYMYVETLNNTPSDIGFSQLYPSGAMNSIWYDFFQSNPTQYSTGQRANITRTSVNRTSVPNRTSYPTRPLFNSS